MNLWWLCAMWRLNQVTHQTGQNHWRVNLMFHQKSHCKKLHFLPTMKGHSVLTAHSLVIHLSLGCGIWRSACRRNLDHGLRPTTAQNVGSRLSPPVHTPRVIFKGYHKQRRALWWRLLPWRSLTLRWWLVRLLQRARGYAARWPWHWWQQLSPSKRVRVLIKKRKENQSKNITAKHPRTNSKVLLAGQQEVNNKDM